MRNAFADEIAKLGLENKDIVLLSGDIGNKLFDKFKENSADRFYNCGVAEANMMGVAAGMALCGFRPVIYTIASFATTRCLEQIRVDACYHKVPVIIVGTGSGLSYAKLGPTHHSCEDIAVLRALPDMTIFCPCDEVELRLGLQAAFELNGPIYIRIGKKGEPRIHNAVPELIIGKSITVKKGKTVCMIVTGTIMPVALKASEILEENGISVQIESFHTVKPIDKTRLQGIFENYRLVASIEEHSLIGGLGSSIAELVAVQEKLAANFVSFGTADEFMCEIGSQEYARKKYGLTPENIANDILGRVNNNEIQKSQLY